MTALVVAVAGLLVAAVFVARALRPAAVLPSAPRHLSIALPADVRLGQGGLAVSPDGRTIVYAAGSDASAAAEFLSGGFELTSSHLYVRRFDSDEATMIPGTEGARAPFFSPDGLSVGYFTISAVMKVSLLGGAPSRITVVAPVSRGGAWVNDDTIVFSAAT